MNYYKLTFATFVHLSWPTAQSLYTCAHSPELTVILCPTFLPFICPSREVVSPAAEGCPIQGTEATVTVGKRMSRIRDYEDVYGSEKLCVLLSGEEQEDNRRRKQCQLRAGLIGEAETKRGRRLGNRSWSR